MRNTSYNDATYAGLIAAVLRARERTGCDCLAISVRGARAAIVLRVPMGCAPGGAFSHYVSAFCSPAHIARQEALADALTPDMLLSHFQVAYNITRNEDRRTVLHRWRVWYERRAALVRQHEEAGRC